MDGKPIWSRNLQKDHGSFNIQWIYGSSPLLYKGKLYVQVLQRERPYNDTALPGAAPYDGPAPSYLLAIDPATGKDLWKHIRKDEAVDETKESYGTPIPHTTAGGREEILLTGGDAVTAHDPATGAEIWRFTAGIQESLELAARAIRRRGRRIRLRLRPQGRPGHRDPRRRRGGRLRIA